MIVGALIDAGVPLDEIRAALGSLIDRSRRGLDRTRAARGNRCDEVPGPRRGGRPPTIITTSHDGMGGNRGARPSDAHGDLRTDRRFSSELCRQGRARSRCLRDSATWKGPFTARPPTQSISTKSALSTRSSTSSARFMPSNWSAPSESSPSPLNVGSGTIRSSHGLYPVPAPATVRLLEGVPIYSGTQRAEMVTPTGALLVTAYATEFGGIPPMKIGDDRLRCRRAQFRGHAECAACPDRRVRCVRSRRTPSP